MGDDYDTFDDIIYGSDGAAEGGVLSGAGLSGYEDTKDKQVTEAGAPTLFPCRYCGRVIEVTTEWEELFYIAQNGPNRPPVIPQGWQYSPNNNTLYESRNCPRCGNPGMQLHYTPRQALEKLQQGISMGYVTPPQIERWKHKIQAAQGAVSYR
jgi:hypothetical protein